MALTTVLSWGYILQQAKIAGQLRQDGYKEEGDAVIRELEQLVHTIDEIQLPLQWGNFDGRA